MAAPKTFVKPKATPGKRKRLPPLSNPKPPSPPVRQPLGNKTK